MTMIIRRLFSLGALGVATALVACDTAAAQAPVRVMSFNIRYGTAPDGDHAWPNRSAHVVSTIRDHAPHLLGVQEALRGQLDLLRSALPAYREVGVGRDDGREAGEYTALLVDTARFAIVGHGTFWLSDTPDVPGSTSWGNRITRISTWARLADRIAGDTIRAYNVHLDHESQPSRERSVALLLRRIIADASGRDAVLVLGDFNADEENAALVALLADTVARLRNAYRVVAPADSLVGTFNAFRGDSSGGMIDHIFVGPSLTVAAAGIDRRRFGALWASDHFAVWAIVRRD